MPLPRNEYLKNSNKLVSGLSCKIQCHFGFNLLNTNELGYTTGVIYISNCTPNETKKVKSLYLVVIAEIIIPNPKEIIAIMSKIMGVKIIVQFGKVALLLKIK